MCTKNCLLSCVYALREEAWVNSMKFKYDPAVGRAHEKYLKMLNEIIDHQEKVEAINE